MEYNPEKLRFYCMDMSKDQLRIAQYICELWIR